MKVGGEPGAMKGSSITRTLPVCEADGTALTSRTVVCPTVITCSVERILDAVPDAGRTKRDVIWPGREGLREAKTSPPMANPITTITTTAKMTDRTHRRERLRFRFVLPVPSS